MMRSSTGPAKPLFPGARSPPSCQSSGNSIAKLEQNEKNHDPMQVTPNQQQQLPPATHPTPQKALGSALPISWTEKHLFNIAYVYIFENRVLEYAGWGLQILDEWQWLSLVFAPVLVPSIPYWLNVAVLPVRIALLGDYFLFSMANIAALALVYATLAVMATIALLMSEERKVPAWLLRSLQLLAALVLTALSLPILRTLLRGLNCPALLLDYGMECMSPAHLPLLAFNALGLVLFIPFYVVGSWMFIEALPTSEHPLAKAHGRIDLIIAGIRVGLVLAYELAAPLSEAWISVYLLLTTSALVYAFWTHASNLPYYRPTANMVRCSMLLSTSAAGATTLLLRIALVGTADHIRWIAMVVAAGLGMVGGAGTVQWLGQHMLNTAVRHWKHIMCAEAVAEAEAAGGGTGSQKSSRGSLQSLSSPSAPGSPKLRALPSPTPPPRLSPLPPKNGSGSGRPKPLVGRAVPMVPPVSEPAVPYPGAEGTASLPRARRPPSAITTTAAAPAAVAPAIPTALGRGKNGSTTTTLPPRMSNASITSAAAVSSTSLPGMAVSLSVAMQIDREETDLVMSNLIRGGSLQLVSTVEDRRPRPRVRVFDSPLQVEVCLRFVRTNPTEKQVALGLQLLERGLAEFPRNALLMLMAAAYLSAYYGAEGTEAAAVLMRNMSKLRGGGNTDGSNTSSGGIPMDVKFLAFMRSRASSAHDSDFLDRAGIESMARDVRLHHLTALYAVRDIWDLIRGAPPISTSKTVLRVASAVARLGEHMHLAQKYYVRLLERSPRDKQLLRAYAQFLAFVDADTVKAAQVLGISEDVEMEESRVVVQFNGSPSFVEATAADADDGGGTGERVPGTPDRTGVLSPPPTINGPNACPQSPMERYNYPAGTHTIDEESEESTVRSDPFVQPPSAGGDPETTDDRVPETKPLMPSSRQNSMSRRIFWKDENGSGQPPMLQPSTLLSPFDSTASEDGDNADISFMGIKRRTTTGAGGGSQTSGTSATQVQRMRTTMRRVLQDRVSAPLTRHLRAWAFASALFYVALAVGLVMCMQLFAASTSVLRVEFATARAARRMVSSTLETVRQLVFTNLLGLPVDFVAAVAALRTNLSTLATVHLPVLAKSWATLATPTPVFRVYNAQLTNTSVNYDAVSYSALQIAQSVVQAGQSALVFARYGDLVPLVVQNVPEIRFLTDNIDSIYQAIRTLPKTGIGAYNQTAFYGMGVLLAALVASLTALALTLLLASKWIVGKYFCYETHLLRMVVGVPKKTASDLVLALEEEIEAFREIIDADNHEELQGIDRRSRGGGMSSSDTPAPPSRKRVANMLLAVGFVVLSGLVLAMFLQAIGSLDLSQGFNRMLTNDDRHFDMVRMRVIANEWISLDDTINNDQCTRSIRSALADAKVSHSLLVNEMDGLSQQFPGLTVMSRNCTRYPTSCVGALNQPYTAQFITQPLNAEIAQYFSLCEQLGTHASFRAPPTPLQHRDYQMTRALSLDLEARIDDLGSMIMAQFQADIGAATRTTGVLFAVTLVVAAVAHTAFVRRMVRGLQRDARAVTAVLYMVPEESDLGVAAFRDAGGVALDVLLSV
ncbi:hypothetical protein BC828DRAFT_377019 [Blastocladiella britannica]|nr:hypothetical protein BC828DRAFT_377019 [Blastocladiella britannica]